MVEESFRPEPFERDSMTQATTSSTYYLYVGDAWSGPFDVAQIRFFLRQHQVSADTYAFDHERQQHHTVGELLSRHPEITADDTDDATGTWSSGNKVTTHRLTDEAPITSSAIATATFDHLGPDLRGLYQSYLDLTEDRTLDRAGSLRSLRDHGAAFRILITASAGDPTTLKDLCAQVMRVGDYLANRHQDHALWDRLEILRGANPGNDPEDAASGAVSVIEVIQERAERAKPGVKAEIIEEESDRWEQPGLRTARGIIADARAELVGTVQELDSVQRAYAQLQEQHAQEIEAARETLAGAESRLADEEAARRQALAEIRSLAAEIHRLGVEHLSQDSALREELARLAEELTGDNATAIAPIAEGLLIRLVTRLRSMAGGETTDVAHLREDLAAVRAELVQARAQVLVANEERDRLRRQLEDQRQAAERAMTSARDREQRLRSTVAAMEVTKDLHQDVMRELEVQLTSAQSRVTEMEGELGTVRTELKTTRSSLDEKSEALQGEMRRAVELKAMLEARREELSVNLRSAEAELQQAQGDTEVVDPALVEALMAKVNHLRTTFETTRRKLDEQQALASRLEEELAASRREAQELRGRSDHLSSELDDARTNLTSAKRRYDELQRAYGRLEQERESLQQEVGRKSTDSITREGSATSSRLGVASGTQRLTQAVSDLEQRLAATQRNLDQTGLALDQERDRARSAQERLESLTGAIEELTAERQHLRVELDQLHAQHFSEHSRHAASLATATQASIDAEKRAKVAMARVVELEQELEQVLEESQVALEPLVRPDDLLDQARAEAEIFRAEAAALRQQLADLTAAIPETGPLADVEERLARALAEREEQSALLQTAHGERDRLTRELSRLRNEHESAAVEHRTALKSARDRLGEAQARVQALERDLEAAKGDTARLTELQAERERLRVDLERTQALVAGQAGGDAAQERMMADLAEASRALAVERERVQTLENAINEARRASDAAHGRATAIEERTIAAAADRDALVLEIERLKGELAMAQAAGHAARSAEANRSNDLERRLGEVAADRDHLITQLAQLNGELTVARQRMARLDAEAIGVERLALEQTRVRELESRLTEARQDHQAALAMASDARTRLAQLHAERDRLQAEVERLRAGGATGTPDAAELVELREKLKKLIRSRRKLRAERDALQEQLERALEAVQVSTRITDASMASRNDALDPLPMAASDEGGLTAKFSSATFTSTTSRSLRRTNPGTPPPAFTSQYGRTSLPAEAAFTSTIPAPVGTTSTRRQAIPPQRSPLAQIGLLTVGAGIAAGAVLATAWSLAPVTGQAWLMADLTTITSPSAGTIRLAARPGQVIEAGGLLGDIARTDPDLLEVTAAEEIRAAAMTAVATAESNLTAWRDRRAATLATLQQAIATGISPAPTLLAALSEPEPTAALNGAQNDLTVAERGVEEARAARERRRIVAITAPEAGTVVATKALAGRALALGDPVLDLARTASLSIDALVPTGDVPPIGSRATVRLVEDHLTLTGQVVTLQSQGTPLIDIRPAVGQAVIRIALDRVPAGVTLGQPARVIYGDGLGAALRRAWWLGAE